MDIVFKVSVATCVGCFATAATGQAAYTNVPGNFSWSAAEVVAGTSTPSALSPGVIEPGEGVRFTLSLGFSPAVGSTVAYSGGAGPGQGTLVCWYLSNMEFVGHGGVAGVFSSFVTPPLIGHDAIPIPEGLLLIVGQTTAFNYNTSNPIESLISFTWTPANYLPRSVWFESHGALAEPYVDSVLIQYGTGPGGMPLLQSAGTPTNHGSLTPTPRTADLVIVPAPAASVVLIAGAALRRRRRAR